MSMKCKFRPYGVNRLPLSLIVVAALALGTCCAGCGGEFDKAWTLGPPDHDGKDLLAGHWEGTWTSFNGRGHGDLRCIVTPQLGGTYQAQFHAIYNNTFTFDQTVTLTATKEPAMWQFQGQQDLGLFAGGLYQYDGFVDAREFVCTYTAKYDHGTFKMTRVVPRGTTKD